MSNSLWPHGTAAYQSPPSLEFSRQEHWSSLLFPSPGDLPNPEIEPICLASPTLAGRFFTGTASWEAPYVCEKKGKVSVAKLRLTLCDPTDGNSSVHVILQARNTGVVSHSLLQGIFSTQGSNPSLLRCRQTAPSESPGKPMLHIAETKPAEMEWSRTWSLEYAGHFTWMSLSFTFFVYKIGITITPL